MERELVSSMLQNEPSAYYALWKREKPGYEGLLEILSQYNPKKLELLLLKRRLIGHDFKPLGNPFTLHHVHSFEWVDLMARLISLYIDEISIDNPRRKVTIIAPDAHNGLLLAQVLFCLSSHMKPDQFQRLQVVTNQACLDPSVKSYHPYKPGKHKLGVSDLICLTESRLWARETQSDLMQAVEKKGLVISSELGSIFSMPQDHAVRLMPPSLAFKDCVLAASRGRERDDRLLSDAYIRIACNSRPKFLSQKLGMTIPPEPPRCMVSNQSFSDWQPFSEFNMEKVLTKSAMEIITVMACKGIIPSANYTDIFPRLVEAQVETLTMALAAAFSYGFNPITQTNGTEGSFCRYNLEVEENCLVKTLLLMAQEEYRVPSLPLTEMPAFTPTRASIVRKSMGNGGLLSVIRLDLLADCLSQQSYEISYALQDLIREEQWTRLLDELKVFINNEKHCLSIHQMCAYKQYLPAQELLKDEAMILDMFTKPAHANTRQFVRVMLGDDNLSAIFQKAQHHERVGAAYAIPEDSTMKDYLEQIVGTESLDEMVVANPKITGNIYMNPLLFNHRVWLKTLINDETIIRHCMAVFFILVPVHKETQTKLSESQFRTLIETMVKENQLLHETFEAIRFGESQTPQNEPNPELTEAAMEESVPLGTSEIGLLQKSSSPKLPHRYGQKAHLKTSSHCV